ncbi:TPA: hypothetical protein SMO99_003827 [Proteus mirabilis]|uniref:Uncharacterized protein n=2 Tax=Morganellaceae TaxID=1903414 RepID=A0AAP2NYM4_PRORE|nr:MULTISPECIES: hypothetical protein [Providencia]EJV1665082.1 hypothetical protein [Klebsiella pneumoniae]ELI9034628.1 hypothetical protein [Morganella morganii]HEJ9425889.1 hypothetical protein [Proteus mirabilis]MBX6950014.1 hypothetical protein [Providencia rettgeri]MBX6957617.1 hypothetical protein [Providencia rettgeri]
MDVTGTIIIFSIFILFSIMILISNHHKRKELSLSRIEDAMFAIAKHIRIHRDGGYVNPTKPLMPHKERDYLEYRNGYDSDNSPIQHDSDILTYFVNDLTGFSQRIRYLTNENIIMRVDYYGELSDISGEGKIVKTGTVKRVQTFILRKGRSGKYSKRDLFEITQCGGDLLSIVNEFSILTTAINNMPSCTRN